VYFAADCRLGVRRRLLPVMGAEGRNERSARRPALAASVLPKFRGVASTEESKEGNGIPRAIPGSRCGGGDATAGGLRGLGLERWQPADAQARPYRVREREVVGGFGTPDGEPD
jgi:hypothetical protein